MKSEVCETELDKMRSEPAAGGLLAFAGVAAIAAMFGTCCLGPMVLVGLGMTGAWMSKLSMLEPLRPWLLAGGSAALLVAGVQIFYKRRQCGSGEACGRINMRRAFKICWSVAALVLLLAFFTPSATEFILRVTR